MRIAVGGIGVECCTFSPLLTRLDDFTLWRGDALLETYPFRDTYRDVSFVPLVRARATPGGPVESAVEQIPYRHLKRPIYPLDPAMQWQP
jgi:microcystin degradation protein MlrC